MKMLNNLYITCLYNSNSQPTKRHKCNFNWIKILITLNNIYLKKEVVKWKNALKRSEKENYPAGTRLADGYKAMATRSYKELLKFP